MEYESHIISIYASLCSDSAKENGHHAVLNAHYHTRLLVDSLKVLSQNIKNHVQKMFNTEAEVRELLHIHYDIYMHEIVDKAYNRLKTSDNLSKYRPLVNRAIGIFLQDERWLAESTARLAVIKHLSADEAGKLLIGMMKEIRDDLQSIDTILEDIDDKNRQYSRISMEKIKAQLYADASLQGKIRLIIQAVRDNEALAARLAHHLLGTGYLCREALYTRRKTMDSVVVRKKTEVDSFELEKLETELKLRIRNQLNPVKVARFLDKVCHPDGTPTPAMEIVKDMASFVRVLYAAAYAESRAENFPYRITWDKTMVQKERFVFREHSFLKQR